LGRQFESDHLLRDAGALDSRSGGGTALRAISESGWAIAFMYTQSPVPFQC
jgi:hypothetical protein